MSGYAVKEVFRTLQGEGLHTGRVAVFLRFAGCNLWNGREDGRNTGTGGCARWCDTDFVGTDGTGGGHFEDADALAEHVWGVWGASVHGVQPFVVCTGGEPLLQLDPALVDALHARGFEIAVETNGTVRAPAGIDWLCVSPKARAPLVQDHGDELKLVYPQDGVDPARFLGLKFRAFTLQPCDGAHREANTRAAIAYCTAHPQWRLGVQVHKVIGVR